MSYTRFVGTQRCAVLLFFALVLTTPGCGSKSTPKGASGKIALAGGGLLAFPGAEGFGARVSGGRGGKILRVTNLNPAGPGSLLEAVRTPGPRIVIFAVSGVIAGDIEIPHGNLTIAGQTAPGAGITIHGRLSTEYEFGIDNIIVRHVRVRPSYDGSPGERFDAIQFSRVKGLILDHVSASYAVDETIDVYEARDVTVQWSTIASSATAGHPEGVHNYGFINGPLGTRVSFLNNLCAHHKARCPAIANGPAEVVNNVAYNVRHGFVHHNPAAGPFNLYGNYFRRGPNDELIPFYFDDENEFRAEDLAYHLSDNFFDDPNGACNGAVENPWRECKRDLVASEERRAEQPFDFTASGAYYAATTRKSAREAYEAVLAGAGAFPRDAVTRRAVAETRERTGAWGARPVPNLLEGLTPSAPPADGDGDGIPDEWERANGNDPADATDAQRTLNSGYPAIEQYVNELAERLVAP